MINSKEEMIELYQGAIDGKEYEKLELKVGAFTGDVKEVWTKHCTDFGFSIGTTYKEIEKPQTLERAKQESYTAIVVRAPVDLAFPENYFFSAGWDACAAWILKTGWKGDE